MHGKHPTLAIDARAIARHMRRPIEVVLHILFARPDEIDRATGDRTGDVHGLTHAVELPPTTEPAATKDHIDTHALDRQFRQLRGEAASEVRLLQTAPDLARIRRDLGHAGLRLESHVCEVRNLVVDIDFFGIGALQRRFHRSTIGRYPLRGIGTRHHERQLDGLRIVGERTANRGVESRRGQTAQIRFIELDFQGFGGLTRHPPRLGHDRHRIVERHHGDHALARAHAGSVETFQ